ncbi:hypothetical protein NC796_23160 [Aliifodinibius sp. S!AR15-10]|uniref:hypothetical protein n=1 Tax=Aliifodinibius sp. S!AR15-10 TaxID=2950437 RepID=UPI0028626468|nr:hypothetical protein [Aliifodinibius sp. S!AR15-10]MDR8394072.1 hypothetical protein [Aliifodinibius sp. S!AR15-10]
MNQRKAVQQFLKRFKQKAKTWRIVFLDDRSKNTQALLDLEITPRGRRDILLNLGVEDYSEGPKPDEFDLGSDLWVFGKTVKNEEVYIKITLGKESKPVICISFHIAEYEMNYPLKKS